MHSTEVIYEHPEGIARRSMLRTAILSPFTTLHDPLHLHRSVAVTDPIFIPTSSLDSNVLTLAWAILLACYSGSTTASVETAFRHPDGSAAATQDLELHLHPQQSVQETLAGISDELKGVLERSDVSAMEEADRRKTVHGTRVSMVSPWTASRVLGSTDASEGQEWHFLENDEILRMVIRPVSMKHLSCSIHYAEAVGFKDLASSLADQFAHLVGQIALSTSDLTLQQLDMISQTDRSTLEQWTPQTNKSVLECCHHLVKAQAEKQPSSPAISAWDGELTYDDLDSLSGRLANVLLANGVRKGMIIPLLFEKSKWMVVAMLAVLKAGGTCVSLCADYPDSYIYGMIKKSAAKGVLCARSQRDRLEHAGFAQWAVPDILETSLCPQEHNVESDPHDVAHIIFTSGSTGEPKGVVLTHEAIATATHYQSNALNVGPSSRVLQFSSYAFDMSVLETWYALTRGGCLCIPSEHQRLWELPSFIQDHRASWAFFTPTLLRSYTPEDLCNLETVVLGGEAVTQDLVAQWNNHLRLFNLWGPSEGCGGASIEILPESWIPGTFGRSACCNLWIVRPDNVEKLVAIGTVGEIVIEGIAVAQGYLNDPAQTSQVFIPPPQWRSSFSQPMIGRFYKTGDLGQYNADGTIRYLSRKDTMVKINGQRVDMDQVEVALRTLEPSRPITLDAVVLQGRNNRSDPVLLAFIEHPVGIEWDKDLTTVRWPTEVPRSFHTEASNLLDRLAESLPRFMVPLFVIPLIHMPIGPTGKVDKKRLRKAVAGMSHTDLVKKLYHKSRVLTPTEESPPLFLTMTENLLLASVAGVLKIQSSAIDLDRPFRELGGDSISAIQVARHLATQGQHLHWEGLLDAEHSLRNLAASIKVAGPCRRPPLEPFSLLSVDADITALRQVAAQQCLVSEADIEDMYPCTPIQEGLFTITSGMSTNAYIDRFLFHLPLGTSPEDVKRAWDVVVNEVPVLRTRIVQPSGAYSYQVVVKQSLDWRKYSSVDDFTLADNALELTSGMPLVRLSCIEEEDNTETLAVTLHHAAYDGQTLSLLLQLVAQAYYGSSGVEHIPFSWFVQHLQQKRDPTAMTNFWRGEMADVEPSVFPKYPTSDYVPRAETTLRRSVYPQSDSVASPTVRTRLAWALLLSLYSGTDDVVFGNVVDGRRGDFPGIEALAGPTIATVPVRCKLDYKSSVRDTLLQLEQARSRAIPFEQSGLQHIARAGEDASVACRFRSLLVVQSNAEGFESPPILGRVETRLDGMQGHPGYGLILVCVPKFESWSLELLVDTNLVPKPQAETMLDQLAHLICQLSRHESMLSELDLLCEEDKTKLLTWHTDAPTQPECCIHDLFSQAAVKQPEAIALTTWEGISMTYAQLDQLTSAIASDSHPDGAAPQHNTICILLPRSHWAPIAMLAAMKSGSPFVLLDLEQSAEHHEKICQQVRACLVVTVQPLADRASKLCETVFFIDLYTPRGASRAFDVNTTTRDIAYMVFTSGSTGEPKSVVIEHGQFAAAAVAQQKHLHINGQSRVLHLSSYAFDSFAVEILTTLCAGGCVCIPSDEESRTGIAAAVQRFQATWIVITPSMLRLVDFREVRSLKTVVAVGESMLVDQAQEWSSQVQLLCGYGPTECCTGASAHPVDHENVDVRNIGNGMGAHLWLAHKNNHNALVPLGAVGEIVLQGPIVGREYLENPSKTQEAFLDTTDWASQLGVASHGRFYKTGDLGRYNENGSVTFLGRDSQQIKLRGQRLDLSLLEHHLQLAFGAGCTIVAALVSPTGSQGHPLLAAMVYLGIDSTVGGDCATNVFCHHSRPFATRVLHVRRLIQEVLPTVMVPSLFLQLPKLPLLVSGKVNRPSLKRAAEAISAQELAALGQIGSQEMVECLAEDEVVAQTLSRWLSEIVQKRFQPSDVQSADNRILGRNVHPAQLGLDSIDMVVLTQSIQREFSVTIPASAIFQSMPSVRDIAAMIESASAPCNESLKPIPAEHAPWWKDYQRLEAEMDRLLPVAKSLCRDRDVTESKPTNRSRNVFLTGGTGFLGTRILQSLVANAEIQSVTVLVRGSSLEAAFARIIVAASQANWWREEYRRVIRVWQGDLTKPNLGLSDENYEVLCGDTFDAIVHCGATVHWLYDYEALQASNVQSTFTLLTALSRRQTPIQFTYVSALRPGEESSIPSSDNIIYTLSSEACYSQTKLVSEMLIQRYIQTHGDQGHSFTIVRPGLMMGTAIDGAANLDDVIWRTVSAALDIDGYNAQEDESWIYISPVDWVASVVIHATFHRDSSSSLIPDKVSIISVDDGLQVKGFWNAIMKATSRSLTPMDGPQWLDRVQERVVSMGSQHPLSPVIEFALATSGCVGASLPAQLRDARQTWYSVQSILWMTVVRNVEYLTSLNFWESSRRVTGQSVSNRTNLLV
ncbi:hypothetical protein N7449_008968 [Penicillium cf. viridicatum]|uniref:Carrier domain-containing protein n=1 Tax=Penicillium cf. viridicatum TaxID=2972119 RepID=A0A9W9JEG0_9EURO|nr:hypothetical protein N7449_008968 [Penicillium cf. viridicatum]